MENWTAETIVAAIRARGTHLRDVDRRAALPIGTASATIAKPNAAGEQAIAEFLGVSAASLWPERYSSIGERLSPQPARHYTPARRFQKAGIAA